MSLTCGVCGREVNTWDIDHYPLMYKAMVETSKKTYLRALFKFDFWMCRACKKDKGTPTHLEIDGIKFKSKV